MQNEMCVRIENVEKSKLLVLFDTLDERDKDIVITMTESLVERHKSNEMEMTGSFSI